MIKLVVQSKNVVTYDLKELKTYRSDHCLNLRIEDRYLSP